MQRYALSREEDSLAFKLDFAPSPDICWIVNSILLILRVLFAAWYRAEHMTILFVYALLSIGLLLFNYYTVGRGRLRAFTLTAFLELFLFMTINEVCLGWEYGFQLHCFAFMSSAMLIDFYMHRRPGLHRLTQVFILVDIVWFLFFRILSFVHLPLYQSAHDLFRRDLYLANATLALLIIFSFILIYIRTVMALERDLRFTATHDGLTGLSNRVRMQKTLDAIDASPEALAGTYIGMFDIDFFKRINDTWGHDAGDAVLRETAEFFRSLEERFPGLSAARWGGEEFVLLYRQPPGTADPADLFEQVRAGLERRTVLFEGEELRWTATIGVAGGAEGDSADALIQLADDRLYAGKRAGRNRVVWTTEP